MLDLWFEAALAGSWLLNKRMEPNRKRVLLARLVSLVYAMEAQRAGRSNRKRDKAARFLESIFNSKELPRDLVAEGQPAAADDDPEVLAQELGYELYHLSCFERPTSSNTKKFWYGVFVRKECKWPGAPAAVVAVRGTWFTLKDVLSDVEVMAQCLHLSNRGPKLRQVVDTVVGMFGRSNVCIAGHSLGAALSLLVAKDLAKVNQPIEAHLFNPPFASFSFVNSSKLREWERKIRGVMLVTAEAVALAVNDFVTVQRLEEARRDFWSLRGWSPYLYLHHRDVICKGYLNFFGDHGSGSRATLEKERSLAPHSTLEIVNGFGFSSAKHLVSSAVLVVATETESGCSPHSLRQWEDIDKVVRVQHINIS